MIIFPNIAGAPIMNWAVTRQFATTAHNGSAGYIQNTAIVGNKLYFSDWGNNWNPRIKIVNLTTGQLIKTLILNESGENAAVTELAVFGNKLYVSVTYSQRFRNPGLVVTVDTTTDTVSSSFYTAPRGIHEILLAKNNSFAYLCSGGQSQGSLMKFTPTNDVSTAVAATGIAGDPAQSNAYSLRSFVWSSLVESDTKLYTYFNSPAPAGIQVINTSTNAYSKDVTPLAGYASQQGKVIDVGNSRAYIWGYTSDYSRKGFLIINTSTDAIIGFIDMQDLELNLNQIVSYLDGTDLICFAGGYDSATATQFPGIVTVDTSTNTVKSASRFADLLPGGQYPRLGAVRKSDTGDIYFGTYTTPSHVYVLNQTTDSFVPGKNSVYFPGPAGNNLTIANNAALQMGAGDFTIEFWWFPHTIASYQTPFDKGYNGTGGMVLQTGAGDGKLTIIGGGVSYIVSANTAFTVNAWNHYAIVRSGTTITMYLNGVSVGSATSSYNFNSTATASIGSALNANPTYPIYGYLSNFRMVKGSAVYSSAFTPPTKPLAAISGTSLLTCSTKLDKDLSANNFTITVNGSPVNYMLTPFAPTSFVS